MSAGTGPGPEERVRAFVDRYPADADIIEEVDYGTPLTIGDLRDVLNELESWRDLASESIPPDTIAWDAHRLRAAFADLAEGLAEAFGPRR